uniref:VWFA domain-containing protein n=1 Tax=Panagrolaimus davidi TaxID=227884 RepID=A0A914QFV1_9BILA
MENEKEAESGCRWHNIDVLFVSDSTENIGEENHRILMNFFISVLKRLGKDDETIHIAMAQFTPEAKYEFSFDSLSSRVLQSIKNIPYTPCRNPDCRSRATSINGIAATALSSDKGNRIISPDILIVVSTSLYQIPELNSGELLIKPASITHAFLITVGNFAPSNGAKVRLQFAATTSQLGAINFESLSELISPLCHSVASFLLVVMAEFLSPSIFGQNNKSLSGQPADLTWWNYLKWDVPTCTRTNEKNTVFWTVACDSDTSNSAAGTITTSTFVLILACVIVTALIFILIFGCAIYRYRNESMSVLKAT